MKLHLSQTDGINVFSAYGQDHVAVNGRAYYTNIVVFPQQIWPRWTDAHFATLSTTDFSLFIDQKIDILLVGTGQMLRFPTPDLLAPLMTAHIGVEIMDTRAACRTYNILATEGRKVAAAILIENPESA